ncbi:hypothetical protein FB470_003251 [Amycolatopsis thermophila]|uniref:Uncharacterized protein n=1 Tax=Amycolatopsis thermophila TaxID=206084 RepID=A0ABU0EVE8_9PSEU|nr:hypothetical protein [Amycolatopsis thermophila]
MNSSPALTPVQRAWVTGVATTVTLLAVLVLAMLG